MSRLGELRILAGLAVGVARAVAIAKTRHSHPVVRGRLVVEGASGPIRVLRDRFGIPHIYATSDADALFGQGFVHAQDRLFQLDLLRRVGAGRLAEVAGERRLASDRFMRRLGLADRAGRDLAGASEEQRELLFAYAGGVNAAVRSLRALPPEYAVLRAAPEPWHPEHSLLVGRLLMLSFATNWDAELERERLVEAIGPERAALVDVAYPADRPTTAGEPYAGAAERLLEAYAQSQAAGAPARGGSNAWAVAGRRTTSGAPLLACDPHLQAGLPGLFHVAHVAGAALDVVGAGVPGLPGIVIGHNQELAWGLTAGLADVSDCYLETIDPDDPGRYRTPDGWERGRVRVERIAVRDGEAVEERVLETRHGPIVGPALAGETRAIALRSTALEPAETVGPLLDANRARTVEAFEEALARWPGATFNFVFAARDGRIGYRLVGSIPRRALGEGLLPEDGARSPGPPPALAGDELPRLLDPASGLIVSANQPPGGEHELGEEWVEPWRAERIAALLAARGEHTVATMQAIQSDLQSEPLVRLRELSLEREVVADSELHTLLAGWDGHASPESAAAAALETVYQELARRLVERVAGPMAPMILGEGAGGLGTESPFHYRLQGRLIEALQGATAPWSDGPEDRDRLLRTSWQAVLETLRDRLGTQPAAWSWGALHRQSLSHRLAAIPGLGRAFSRGPYAIGGDVNTVWQGGYTVYAGPAGTAGFSPAYRQVLDLGRWDRSTFQLPAGNSGIPGHPRYDDCVEEFLAARQRPLLYSRAVVEANVEHALDLAPRTETAA